MSGARSTSRCGGNRRRGQDCAYIRWPLSGCPRGEMREAMVGQQRSTTLQIKLQPYRKRPIRFLGRYEQKGWHIKLYGISSKGEAPNTSLVVAAKALCQRELPQPAREEGRYGVAVLIVHEADDGNYVLIDW